MPNQVGSQNHKSLLRQANVGSYSRLLWSFVIKYLWWSCFLLPPHLLHPIHWRTYEWNGICCLYFCML